MEIMPCYPEGFKPWMMQKQSVRDGVNPFSTHHLGWGEPFQRSHFILSYITLVPLFGKQREGEKGKSTMLNHTHPDHMTAEERLDEAAAILATAIKRMKEKKKT